MACSVICTWSVNTSTSNQHYVQRNNTAAKRWGGTGLNQHEGPRCCFCAAPLPCVLRHGKACALAGKLDPISSLPPSLSPFLCQVLGSGSWLEMVFSEVRQWRGPKGWPVHGHCAWGLRPITISRTEVCGCQWPGLPAIWFSSSSSGFFLESVAF